MNRLLLALATLSLPPAARAAESPNVIFILADDRVEDDQQLRYCPSDYQEILG